jgi:tRNA-specific 2-thiouridylase
VSVNGEVLGEHSGITDYTIGQRKGLGIALGVPAYVCDIRPESNEVVLGPNEALFDRRVVLRDFNCMAVEELKGEMRAYGKLRYSQKSSPCVIRTIENGLVEAVFDEPQRAATSGQGAVFYDEDGYVIGGGVIMRGYKGEG